MDDESIAIRRIEEVLEAVPEIMITGSYTDPVQALLAIRQDPPDLLFLDIQMPGLTGFDIVKSLRQWDISIHVVFVTAYDEFAIEAIRHEAFGYLLKPLSPGEIRETVDRLKRHLDLHHKSDRIDQILARMEGSKIPISDRSGVSFFDPRKILWVEAGGNYSTLYMNGKSHLVTRQIGAMEELLAKHGFVRSSRSVLINVRYLVRIDRRQRICILENDGATWELPISEERMRGWG